MRDDQTERADIERQLAGQYQIVRTLGSGAFGAVYLARERLLHRLVAIKVLRSDRAWSEEERERLLREARTLANLSHPAVVPLLAFGESEGTIYMVMPFVGGETLADRLQYAARFDPDETRRILIEIADALAYVHGEGVLHRDLKPENVLLERAGAVDDSTPPRVRLIDFGVAAFPGRDLGVNATYETWGTPQFMAPEQALGEPDLDPRSEIYSLGVLGFLMLGGRLPFDAISPTERLTQQRRGPVIPLDLCAPGAPADLVASIEKCLAFDPEQRWRRARDLRDALVRGMDPAGAVAPLAVVRQRLRPKRANVERLDAARRRALQPRQALFARLRGAFSGLDADLRFALRTLRKTPGFTAAIVLTLAIGLGATTVVFSAVEALVLRELPAPDPASLVILQESREGPNQSSDMGASTFRYDRYLVFKDAASTVFTGVAAQHLGNFDVRTGNETREVWGQLTSGNYWDVLGVRPALGRFYTADEDTPAAGEPVVVLGNNFWRRLGGDSSILGKPLFVEGRALTVIGVAPAGFNGAFGSVFASDLWLPASVGWRGSADVKAGRNPGYPYVNLFARLRPGVTDVGATAALKIIAPRVAPEDPATRIVDAWVEPLKAVPLELRAPLERYMKMLLAVAALVLLLAAANVAGMLLARATTRRREVATRMAVGAARARVVRQLVVESMLLCGVAGVAGVLITAWLTRLLNGYQPPFPVPVAVHFGLNKLVLGVAAMVMLGTGMFAGIAPAIQATAVDLATAMKEGGLRGASGRARLRSSFVVAQVALSVVLMAVASLFIRSLDRSLRIDPGFVAEGVAHGQVNVGRHAAGVEERIAFVRDLVRRLEARGDIAAASYADAAPLLGNTQSWGVKRPSGDGEIPSQWGMADVGFIELLRTPMIAGRTFTTADVKGKPYAAVINQSLAAAIWPGEPPSAVLGREIESLGGKLTVVGVMANGKYRLLQEAQRNYGYAAFAQVCCWGNPILFVKSRTNAAAALRAMREELTRLDPNIALHEAAPLQSDIDRFLVPQRLGSWLIGVFALIGLLLAMTGLYGVLAFGVAQRMREFGVRLALGAQGRDIVRLVLRHGLVLVILGVTLGLGAAFAVGRLMSTFLYGLSGADPVTFTVVPILLLIVAVGASLIPARRGAAADPMTSLRAE